MNDRERLGQVRAALEEEERRRPWLNVGSDPPTDLPRVLWCGWETKTAADTVREQAHVRLDLSADSVILQTSNVEEDLDDDVERLYPFDLNDGFTFDRTTYKSPVGFARHLLRVLGGPPTDG